MDNLSEVSNKKAFVFSTSGQGKKGYNNSLEVKLKDKGFQIVGSFVCKGYDIFGSFKIIGGIAKGRPSDKDLKNDRDFAESLL